jgi:hypothetical protein
VVLLEVQMRADIGFHHRLAAQPYRFLQLHPRIEYWRVVVITPHQRLQLGPVKPLRSFLEQVHWVSLEELGQQENLDAAVAGRQACSISQSLAICRHGSTTTRLAEPGSRVVSHGRTRPATAPQKHPFDS